MENLPKGTDSDPEDDSSSSKGKSKRAGSLGAFLVEPKSQEQALNSEKKEGFLNIFGADKKTETDEDVFTSDHETEDSNETHENDVETIHEDERLFVEREFARDRLAQVEEIPEQETEEESMAREAATEFYEKIIEEDIDSTQALSEILAELDIEEDDSEAEIAQSEKIEVTPDQTPVDLTESAISLHETDSTTDEEDEADDHTTATSTAASASSLPSGPSPSSSPPSSTGTVGAGRGSRGSGGAGPGVPPTPPFYRGMPLPPPGGASTSPNVMPQSSTNKEFVYINDNRDILSAALLGGIVGYLIGRRRGRIKTERKLLPVQKKLEQQVMQLREGLVAKEFTIRQAAIEKQRTQSNERAPVALRREVNKKVDSDLLKHEVTNFQSREVAPEANHLHQAVKLGKIGEVLVLSQAESTPTMTRTELEPIEKHVETLSRSDLLELSSKIVVEGTTLLHAYETHLLSEKALRRVVIEHLQGGDVRKALRRELVEHQIDFERDPILRDRAQKAMASNALNNLVQQAVGKIPGDNQEPVTHTPVRDSLQAVNKLRTQHRAAADIVMGSTITALLVLVVILLITRS